MIMKKFNTRRGFTLIETMVAITILTLAISGAFMTANSSMTAAETSRGKLTASYLAQEGIEYVRMMRDDSYLNAYYLGGTDTSSAAWADFTTGGNYWSITKCIAKTCTLDPAKDLADSPLQQCSGTSCTPLYLATNGTYTQQNVAGSTLTPFTRTIQVIDVTNNDKKIVSTVSWFYHTTQYSVTIIDHLTPWQ